MPTMTIVRGLPGSGKSTYANNLGCVVISPMDMLCRVDGNYQFNARKSRQAWEFAQTMVETVMMYGCDICVAEVLPNIGKINKYKKMAEENGYTFRVIRFDVSTEHSKKHNIHAVPDVTIESMNNAFVDYPGEIVLFPAWAKNH